LFGLAAHELLRLSNVLSRDAPIRHWPIIGRLIIGA